MRNKKSDFICRIGIIIFPAILLCTSFVRAQPNVKLPAIQFKIKNEAIHRIDARLFGQFMERPSWGEIGIEGGLNPKTHTVQPKVKALLRQMEIPVIRFPGGTDVDFMDWRDMIDAIPGRPGARPVSTGHRGHKVSNYFGYDEFLDLCEDLQAEPILVVNFRDALMKVKPVREAALHAASLVAYCNASTGTKNPEGMYDWPALRARNGRGKPYKVKYFQIGNETWFFLNQMKNKMSDQAADFYFQCLTAYIETMSAVDPSIRFIVDGHDGNMAGVVKKTQQRFGEKIAFFATHFYSPWAITKVFKEGKETPIEKLTPQEIWYSWIALPQFDSQGQSILHHSGIRNARRLGYPVAITEWNWNGWWRVQPAQPALNSSWAKGLGAAGYLHAFMRSGDVIQLGCQSMLVGNAWGITAIHADAQAKRPPYYMPTGQATMFYSQHHGNQLVKLESENVPTYDQSYRMGGIVPQKQVAYIDALATVDKQALYFHAINRHFDQAIEITIDVSSFSPLTGLAEHHLLQGRLYDRPKAGEDRQVGTISKRAIKFDGNLLKVELPYRSVSCIELKRREKDS